MDVARKVIILARECGMEAQLADLQISSLVPAGLEALPSADAFMARLPQVTPAVGPVSTSCHTGCACERVDALAERGEGQEWG